MAYNVTSWFIDQTLAQRPASIVRKFTIGTSDYSDRVVNWPTIQRKWDLPQSVALSVTLNNHDGQFNGIYSDPLEMRNSCDFSMGFTHPTSGDETISLYTGTITRVRFAGGQVTLSLRDKFKQFSERSVGDRDSPAVFSGGTYLPSDVAWTVITSYGGFSSVQSTSNPDINWDSFQSWAAVFSENSIFTDARFDGQKTTECLRKLSRYTQSAIYIEEDKLTFKRFLTIDANVTSLGPDELMDSFSVEIDDSTVINRQYCWGGYDPDARSWSIQGIDADSGSVNSYGLREEIEKDQNVWYTTSAAAIDYSQRIITTRAEPTKRLVNNAGLQLLPRQIGETISVVDSFMAISDEFRIMEYAMSMETGRGSYKIDNTQTFQPFRLDISTLNNETEVLA